MDSGRISRRYAKALLTYAVGHKAEERVYENASVLCRNFNRYGALKRVLGNRMLSAEKKIRVTLECSGENVSPQFERFIRLVVRENREEFLQTMCMSYMELVRERSGLIDVDVVTAVALDEDTKRKMTRRLGQLTSRTVKIRAHVDASLIGGYVFRWDTYRLDASVRASLRRIEKSLSQIEL